MCDICTLKAKKISKMANYFREKADETTVEYYIKKMNATAASLDQLAIDFSARCRCGDELYQRSGEPLRVWHGEWSGGNTLARGSGSELATAHH